ETVVGNVKIVPLAVDEASAERVAEVMALLWGGAETRVVISSDLSHYHDCETARVLDQATASAIEELNGEALIEESACGQITIQGLLLAARQRGLRAQTLALRNSSDSTGPRDRVVGYGAFAFA